MPYAIMLEFALREWGIYSTGEVFRAGISKLYDCI